MSLEKVHIQEGTEEAEPLWNPGDSFPLVRWWDGVVRGNDPAILRAALSLPDGPAEVVLPVGRAVAYLTIDVTQALDRIDPDWQISLQGAGPSPLSQRT
ncbi:hypothetical protein [Streptomyces sp. TBY4]|uniref:hypothetical protein n=1 Tax=Streptomyces sp. TBY4 TaxID=2962030 RepID=UPI0020B82953|nr:hypothetical protein [Streptomyces sp. TBY4]MCP3758198.1 hypothetical protein [Streptomyces sp. TBY4]